MTVRVGFADYPVSDDALNPTAEYNFNIVVLQPVCDCSLISWNEPDNIPRYMFAWVVTTPAQQDLDEAGPLESSLTSTTAAAACDHANDECNYDYTIYARLYDPENPADGVELPDWLVYD